MNSYASAIGASWGGSLSASPLAPSLYHYSPAHTRIVLVSSTRFLLPIFNPFPSPYLLVVYTLGRSHTSRVA
jgi:hypothetical protein